MPRKNSGIGRVATVKDEALVVQPPVALSLEERLELRKVFDSAVFKKALKNCRAYKVGVNDPFTLLASPQGGQIALMRYHEIKGWEAFEKRLAQQADDPKAERVRPTQEYTTPV